MADAAKKDVGGGRRDKESRSKYRGLEGPGRRARSRDRRERSRDSRRCALSKESDGTPKRAWKYGTTERPR